MTIVTGHLYSSPLEGSSVLIRYDDGTLTAVSLVFSCGPKARSPLTWWYETDSGTYRTGTVSINTAISVVNFPSLVQGVSGLDGLGNTFINWPFKFFGFGHSDIMIPPSAI